VAIEKTDSRSPAQVVISGTLYSLAALIGIRLLTVVRAVAVARILGRSQLGFLTVLNQVVDTVSALAGFGITIAMTKFIAEHADQSRERLGSIIRTCLTGMSVPLVIACALLFGFAPALARVFYHDAAYAGLFRLAAVIFAVQSLYTFGQGALQGLKEIKARSLADIITFAVGVPVVIGLTVVARITGAVAGQLVLVVAGAVVVGLILFRVLRTRTSVRHWRYDRTFLPQLANLALPSFLSGLAMTPAVLLTTNMLFQTVGSEPTGLFSIALTMFSMILFLPLAVGMPLVPSIAEIPNGEEERLQRLTSVAVDIVGFVVLLATTLVAVLAPAIVIVLYGPQFAAGWHSVVVMSGAAFLSSIGLIAGNYVLGTGRGWVGLLFNAVWFVAIIACSLLLVPAHAEVGLAYSWWVAYLLEIAVVLIYLRFRARVPVGYVTALCLVSCATTVLWPLVFTRTSGILRLSLGFTFAVCASIVAYLLLPAKSELRKGLRSGWQGIARRVASGRTPRNHES
jgi:O-antigen/teichoic acid export membrane protein